MASSSVTDPVIALVILVFVDAVDAGSPLPGAGARAAEEALGPDVTVAARRLPGDSPLNTVIDRGREEHATIVARISWMDDKRTNARLEVAATDASFVRSSTVSFDAADPVAERGRALGLVLAALVAPEKQAHMDRARAAQAAAPPVAAVATSPPLPQPERRLALDAAVEGGFALAGAGSGVGGALGLRWHPARRIGLRLGAQARFGEVARAQSAAMDLAAAAGVAVFALAPSAERRLAIALRADALLIYQSLSHLSDDDPAPVRSARLLPGVMALAEAQWAVSPTLALVLAGGAEIALGSTDVFVHQEKVAELAPLRLVLQGGLVARF
jgi:hypothetical protein